MNEKDIFTPSEEEQAVLDELMNFDADKIAKAIDIGVEAVKTVEGIALGTCIYSVTKQFVPEGAKWYTKAAFAVTAYSLGALAANANDERINQAVGKVASALVKLTGEKET